MILQSWQFIPFCVQKVITYQLATKLQKRLFLLMTLCTLLMRTAWLMRILSAVSLSTLKLLQKSDTSIENGSTFPDPMKNPSSLPATIKISVLLMSSNIVLMSFWTRTYHRTWLQQLLCHSDTLIIHTLCPISALSQKLTNLEQTHIRCSLHCERWTVKGRDCALVLHSFKKNAYRMDKWTKQLLRLRSWVMSGNQEQWMEFHRFSLISIVTKCSCLFQLFDLIAGTIVVVFLENFFLYSLSLMTLSKI